MGHEKIELMYALKLNIIFDIRIIMIVERQVEAEMHDTYSEVYKLCHSYESIINSFKHDQKIVCNVYHKIEIKYIESKLINETNIIRYINCKHTYNTNDEKWLIERIKQIINDNKCLYFEDYVKLFRDRFHRINEDDERLYKLIKQEMKIYETKYKTVNIW